MRIWAASTWTRTEATSTRQPTRHQPEPLVGWGVQDRRQFKRPAHESYPELRAEALACFCLLDNDPAAGSPTATLLRLLPGSSHCDQISFQHSGPPKRPQSTSP